ncbi:hypothetical protein [Roseburia inulinivorans]|uniref:hypothetical protein n=1 Tax=Roseburia inulinivorans TaxID=360807 RepID=UPI0003045D8F|nr:hypothetical protein [Roseburia inulinivorans]
MKKTDWIDVIGKIDPAYVKEAEQWSKAAQKREILSISLQWRRVCVFCWLEQWYHLICGYRTKIQAQRQKVLSQKG